MAPVIPKTDPIKIVEDLIKNNRIAVFSKTTCPFCMKVMLKYVFFYLLIFLLSIVAGETTL
jgi:hypothetical protein